MTQNDAPRIQEAVRQAHTAWTKTSVPKHILELFSDESCTQLTASSSTFWILVAALKAFVVCPGPPVEW